MGYTHYWRSTSVAPSDEQIARAFQDLRIIVDAQQALLANNLGKPGTKPEISSAHSAVAFNGVEPNDFETFTIALAHSLHGFCKTGRRPYDVVVVACLCALSDRLGPAIHVTSDGYSHEWEDGRQLAAHTLGRSIRVPTSVRVQS